MKKFSGLFFQSVALIMFISVAVTPALSQENTADNMQMLRDHLRTGKKLVIADAMQLTTSEAEAFWPVYTAYQKELAGLGDRMLSQIEYYAQNYSLMTDEAAKKLVGDYIQVENDRIKLMQAYLPKFRDVLPEIKVARYYQLENKINAVVKYQLAAKIPFVK